MYGYVRYFDIHKYKINFTVRKVYVNKYLSKK